MTCLIGKRLKANLTDSRLQEGASDGIAARIAMKTISNYLDPHLTCR
jgi:hypothetical protein